MSRTIQFHQAKDRLPWSPCPVIRWAWCLLKGMTLHPWLRNVPSLWSSLTSWVPTEARRGYLSPSQLKNQALLLMRKQLRNHEIVSCQALKRKLRTRCFLRHEPWRLDPRKHNEQRCRCRENSQNRKPRSPSTRTIRFRTSSNKVQDSLNNKWLMSNGSEPQQSRRSHDYRSCLLKLSKQHIWDERERKIKITRTEQWSRAKLQLYPNLNQKSSLNLK